MHPELPTNKLNIEPTDLTLSHLCWFYFITSITFHFFALFAGSFAVQLGQLVDCMSPHMSNHVAAISKSVVAILAFEWLFSCWQSKDSTNWWANEQKINLPTDVHPSIRYSPTPPPPNHWPVWVLMWAIKWCFSVNFLVQWVQGNLFWPSWILIWRVRFPFLAKTLRHTAQLCSRSLENKGSNLFSFKNEVRWEDVVWREMAATGLAWYTFVGDGCGGGSGCWTLMGCFWMEAEITGSAMEGASRACIRARVSLSAIPPRKDGSSGCWLAGSRLK